MHFQNLDIEVNIYFFPKHFPFLYFVYNKTHLKKKQVSSKAIKNKSLLLNCVHIDPSQSKQIKAFSNIVKPMVTYIVLPKNILSVINYVS